MKDQRIIDYYADMDIDELEFALEDLNNAIADEKSWMDVCPELAMENIKKFQIEAAYVRKLIKELMVE